MNTYIALYMIDGKTTGCFTSVFGHTDSQAKASARMMLNRENTQSDGYILAQKQYNQYRQIERVIF